MRILDLLAVIALALATLVVIVGSVSLYLGSFRLSIRAVSCAFAAVALAAIRHAAFPSVPLHQRLSAGVRALRANPPRLAAVLGLASRVGVLVVGYLAVVTIGFPPATEGLELSADPLLNLPARFDAGWYGGIALDGYSFEGRFDKQQNVAFFPAMPGLMRAVGAPAGASQPTVPRPLRLARVLWGGVVISVVAFAWASNYLVRLAREMMGEARAPAAAALMAAYPFAIFFSAPYTEALFVLAAVGAFYHLRRDEWVQATTWGIVAGLSRPNGCLLTIALVCLVAERRWRAVVRPIDLLKLFKSGLAAAAPALGMLAYSAYVHEVTGSWFGWARLHEAWGRSFQGLAPVSRGLASVSVSRLTADGLLRLSDRRAVRCVQCPRCFVRPGDAVAGRAPARSGLGGLLPCQPRSADARRRGAFDRTTVVDAVSDVRRAGGRAAAPRGHAVRHRVGTRPGAGGGVVLHLAPAILRTQPTPVARSGRQASKTSMAQPARARTRHYNRTEFMRDSRSHRRYAGVMRSLVVILLAVCFGSPALPSIRRIYAQATAQTDFARGARPRSRTASVRKPSSWRRRAARRSGGGGRARAARRGARQVPRGAGAARADRRRASRRATRRWSSRCCIARSAGPATRSRSSRRSSARARTSSDSDVAASARRAPRTRSTVRATPRRSSSTPSAPAAIPRWSRPRGAAVPREVQPAEALKSFQAALKADPDWAPAHAGLARVLEDEDPPKAAAAADEGARDRSELADRAPAARAACISTPIATPRRAREIDKALAVNPSQPRGARAARRRWPTSGRQGRLRRRGRRGAGDQSGVRRGLSRRRRAGRAATTASTKRWRSRGRRSTLDPDERARRRRPRHAPAAHRRRAGRAHGARARRSRSIPYDVVTYNLLQMLDTLDKFVDRPRRRRRSCKLHTDEAPVLQRVRDAAGAARR